MSEISGIEKTMAKSEDTKPGKKLAKKKELPFAETVPTRNFSEEATTPGGTSLEELELEERSKVENLNRIRKEIGLPELQTEKETSTEQLDALEKILKISSGLSFPREELEEILSKEKNGWERGLALLQKFNAAEIPVLNKRKIIYEKMMDMLRKQTQSDYLVIFEDANIEGMSDQEKNKMFGELKDLDDLFFHKEKWLAENLNLTTESGGSLTFEKATSRQEGLNTQKMREEQAKKHLDKMIDIINKMRGISTKERLKRIETIVDEINKRIEDIKKD